MKLLGILRRWRKRLVRQWNHWRRAGLALRQPLRFAEWVNSERASVQIWNDPSGRWNVQIGCLLPSSNGKTLGEAMAKQFLMLDNNEEWEWTGDFLSQPPNIH